MEMAFYKLFKTKIWFINYPGGEKLIFIATANVATVS